MDREAWWATVCGIAKSRTRLSESTANSAHTFVLDWPKSSFGFSIKMKDTFFIFTKNFIEQHSHLLVLLSFAIFQATS